jgi:hypothetical protein
MEYLAASRTYLQHDVTEGYADIAERSRSDPTGRLTTNRTPGVCPGS